MANKLKIKGMAQQPKKQKQKKPKSTNNTKRQVVAMAGQGPQRGMRMTLDTYGAAYARLLADPCGANMVPPAFPGAGGGMLTRFDSVFTFGNAATDTAQTLVWCPNAQPGSQVYLQTAANDSTVASFGGSTSDPGRAFLLANAGEYRCIAACVQVMYPGTELNRSGFLATDINPGFSTTILPTGTTPASWYQLCQNASRVPASMVEQRWYPSSAETSETFFVGSSNPTSTNCIMVSAAGYPVSTGLRYRLVTVVEWWPKNGLSMMQNNQTVPPSGNTIDQVLRALGAAGKWAYKNADTIASTAVRLGLLAA